MVHFFRIVLAGFYVLLISSAGLAAPASFLYQGRILTSTGVPLEYGSVAFEFTVLAPNGTCILYTEQVNNVDMRNSKGIFEVPIGSGIKSYPSTPAVGLLDVFSNAKVLTCSGGSTYTPQGNHGRVLRVQFYDGVGWRLISPDSTVRSVPFAAFAGNADKLGSKSADEFVAKPSTCTAGQVIIFDGANFKCDAVSGGGGSGTVTEVLSGNSYLSVTNATTLPLLTLNVGTTANTVAAGNDSRFSDTRIPKGSAGGDLGGSYPNPSVAKIQGVGVDFSTAPNSGDVLTYNGTSWISQALPAASSGTVTGVTAGTGLTGGTINTSGTIGLGTALSGLNAVATNGYIQRTGAGAYATTSGSIAASNNTLVLRDGSGVSSFYGVGLSGATSGVVTLQTPLISGTYALTLPDAQGAANQVMANDGNGLLSWVNVPAAPGTACGAGNVLTYNGSAFTCVPDQVGSAGGGIVTLNSQTGSSQSFANGTTGNLPHWSSASDVHTLNIPMARTGGVSAGLISKLEYDIFNSKQAALTYVPLDPAQNLSELTDATAARTNLGLGAAALKNAPASGDAASGEVVLGEDTRLTNPRTPSGAAGGDLGGNYPNPDVNRIKGVGLLMTSLTSGNFLKYNGTNWINSVIDPGDVTGLTAALGSKLDQAQISGTCAANSTLVFSSVSGMWTCTSIGIADSQVTFASKAAKTFLAAPTGGAGAPTFRTIASSDLPASITDAAWTANGGNVYRASGNVGIGIVSPTYPLHVNGTIKSDTVETSGLQYNGTATSFYPSTTASAHIYRSNASGSSYPFTNTGHLILQSWSSLDRDIAFVTGATPSVKMVIAGETGNVGIGTISPSQKLSVIADTPFDPGAQTGGADPARAALHLQINNSAGTAVNGAYGAAISFSGLGNGRRRSAITNVQTGADVSYGGLAFLTSTGTVVASDAVTEKMRIMHNGNVGIGTSTPVGKLTVSSSGTLAGNPDNIGNAYLAIQNSDGTSGIYFDDNEIQRFGPTGDLNIRGADYINLSVGDAKTGDSVNAVRIQRSGNVGIGTGTPNSKLSVGGVGTTASQFTVHGTGKTSATYGIIHRDSDNSSVFYSRDDGALYTAGPMGIGMTVSGSYALRMAGNLYVQGSNVNCVIGNGTGGTSCTSDARLKENVTPISDALAKILQIRGVEFDWNNKTPRAGQHAIGVIAQEVEKVFPTLVNIEKDSGYRVVDYAGLVSPLIESTKDLYGLCVEQNRKLASVEEKLAHEQKRNDDLEKRLQALEKALQELKN